MSRRRNKPPPDHYFDPQPAKPAPQTNSVNNTQPPRPLSDEERARHSVYNELDIFPRREPVLIERDWSCNSCGYNLRGMMTGSKCPECGEVNLFAPPPDHQISYAEWFKKKKQQTTNAQRLFVLMGIILMAGPLAVVGTFLTGFGRYLGPVIIGPVVEEIMKITMLLLVVERRPWLVRHVSDLRVAAMFSAFGFAAIENVIYLNVYISNPSFELTLWRWIVCTALHVSCTAIAATGVVKIWHRVDTEGREPDTRAMYQPLVTAIALHGSYNAIATFAHYADFGF